MPPVMEKPEVADFLRVSPRTVDRLRASGALPAVLIRGRVLFLRDDVLAYIQSQRTRN